MKRNYLSFVFVCLSSLALCGFKGCFGDAYNPNQGFTIDVADKETNRPGGPGTRIPRPHALVSGDFDHDYQFSSGNTRFYDAYTNLIGQYYVNNGRNGFWHHFVNFFEPCGTTYHAPDPSQPGLYSTGDNSVQTDNLSELEWTCEHYTTARTAFTSTHYETIGNLPSSLMVGSTKGALSSDYGMPVLYIYGTSNGQGGLQRTLTANSVTPDHQSASFDFPTGLNASLYGLVLMNKQSDGSEAYVDTTFLSIGAQSYVPGAFGVAGQSVSTYSYYSYTDDPYGDQTCAGQTSFYLNTSNGYYPVVSEYFNNALNVAGSEIPTGQQPSAVMLFGTRCSTPTRQTDLALTRELTRPRSSMQSFLRRIATVFASSIFCKTAPERL